MEALFASPFRDLSSFLNRYPSAHDIPSRNQSASLVAAGYASQVSAFQHHSSNITIVTDEGDRVTLSSNSQQQLEYSRYDRFAHVEDGHGSSASVARYDEQMSFTSSSAFSMSVEGELSEEELEDVRQAIRAAQSALGKGLGGDLEGAVSEASRIGELDSISSLTAHAEYERKISIAEQATYAQTSGVPSEYGESGPEKTLTPDELMLQRLRALLEETNLPRKMIARALRALFPEDSHDRLEKADRDLMRQLLNGKLPNLLTGVSE